MYTPMAVSSSSVHMPFPLYYGNLTLTLVVFCFICIFAIPGGMGYQSHNSDVAGKRHYLNQWAVKVYGGREVADTIAVKHGLINRGQVYNEYDPRHTCTILLWHTFQIFSCKSKHTAMLYA